MKILRVQFVHVVAVLAAVAWVLGASFVAEACPFCNGPTLTLSEQFAKADAAVEVRWVEAKRSEQGEAGSTTYEVVRVFRDPSKSAVKGSRIQLTEFRAGKPGDRSLLLGSKGKASDTIEWSSPLAVTATSLNYIVQAPASEVAGPKRLEYFIKFLEFPDQLIANDAYAEFANAPYKDIVPLADKMPREKLLKWLVSSKVSATRLGLYGMMLGLCGDMTDASAMERKITEKTAGSTDDPRLGIDGVIGGFLLLTGEAGLPLIERTKFKDKQVPFSETFAAIQAVRFIWSYGSGKIPAERLRASMRLLLDRPDLMDLVLGDLARWKDWSIQKRLMDIYGTEAYSDVAIKRAIIKYMLAATKDVPKADETRPDEKTGSPKLPQHVADATACLQQLRKKDPKMVSDVERFFRLQ